MSTVYGVWRGGLNYGASDVETDLETFASLADAIAAMRSRERSGHHFRQSFAFVNRPPEDVYCPCVGRDSSLWIWRGAHDSDNVDHSTRVPDYPDCIISFGPRGGIRVENA